MAEILLAYLEGQRTRNTIRRGHPAWQAANAAFVADQRRELTDNGMGQAFGSTFHHALYIAPRLAPAHLHAH